MLREIARNLVLHHLPAPVAHRINVYKNITRAPLEKEMRFLHLARAGGDAIDVGANLGLYSELMASLFSSVTAIEPQPKLVSYLKQVLPENVNILEAVASDAPGTTQLFIPRMIDGHSPIWRNDALASVSEAAVGGSATDKIYVPSVKLDSLVFSRKIDFIKIDVEGFEASVLEGARDIIDRDKPIMLIELELRLNPKAEDVFARLGVLGYRPFNVIAGHMKAASADVLRHNLGSPDYESNFFFVHAKDWRLKRFC